MTNFFMFAWASSERLRRASPRPDVVWKEAAGIAPLQLGDTSDAELRFTRSDVVRKESMATDPWPA
jgi:hypothetical protein